MVAFTLNKKGHRRLVVLSQIEVDKMIGCVKVGMLANAYRLLEDFLSKYILGGCF